MITSMLFIMPSTRISEKHYLKLYTTHLLFIRAKRCSLEADRYLSLGASSAALTAEKSD